METYMLVGVSLGLVFFVGLAIHYRCVIARQHHDSDIENVYDYITHIKKDLNEEIRVVERKFDERLRIHSNIVNNLVLKTEQIINRDTEPTLFDEFHNKVG